MQTLVQFSRKTFFEHWTFGPVKMQNLLDRMNFSGPKRPKKSIEFLTLTTGKVDTCFTPQDVSFNEI